MGRKATCSCVIPGCPVSAVVCFRRHCCAPGRIGPARYSGSMPKRRPYPSDLSDARWELIEPVLTAWRFERRGRALAFGRPPGWGWPSSGAGQGEEGAIGVAEQERAVRGADG